MNGNRELGTRDFQSVDGGSSSSVRESLISPDTILSALANEHRRAILSALENAPEMTLDYELLVDLVATRVWTEGGNRSSDEHRQGIRTALHHTHLPILHEARIVDYEDETGNIQFVGGELERVLLKLIDSYRINE